jgi:hypothetical protein
MLPLAVTLHDSIHSESGLQTLHASFLWRIGVRELPLYIFPSVPFEICLQLMNEHGISPFPFKCFSVVVLSTLFV